MKISDVLNNKKTLSFEVFPPKEDKPLKPLSDTIDHLKNYNPDFISCTYGAGGSNEGRSVEVCTIIHEAGLSVLPHFTCIGNTEKNLESHIGKYLDIGIDNLLLLRGDIPKGQSDTGGDFEHASDLIQYFKKNHPDVSLGAAAYPEVHIESSDEADDLKYLKRKQELGADFFITQLCHDAEAYKRFMEKIRNNGITIPVIVGLMPILNNEGTVKMTLYNGCSVPRKLAAIFGRFERDPVGFKDAGKEYTAELIDGIMKEEPDGIHMYTLNKYNDVDDIIKMSVLKGGI